MVPGPESPREHREIHVPTSDLPILVGLDRFLEAPRGIPAATERQRGRGAWGVLVLNSFLFYHFSYRAGSAPGRRPAPVHAPAVYFPNRGDQKGTA